MRKVVFGRMVRSTPIFALLLACGGEDWGGPKGAAPPRASAAPVAWRASPDSGFGAPAFDAALPPPPPAPPAPKAEAKDGAPAASAGLVAHVESSLSGGKIPGYEDTVAGVRPSLKACVENKGEIDAVVEITAKVGPKGSVTGTDTTGGTQFAQGAVPCLTKRIEAATFKKPTEGSPRVTFRVKMRRD